MIAQVWQQICDLGALTDVIFEISGCIWDKEMYVFKTVRILEWDQYLEGEKDQIFYGNFKRIMIIRF